MKQFSYSSNEFNVFFCDSHTDAPAMLTAVAPVLPRILRGGEEGGGGGLEGRKGEGEDFWREQEGSVVW